MVNRIPSNPSSEALIKPKLIPPVHRDQVTEPLMCKLVRHNVYDAIAVLLIGSILVEEHSGRAVGNETPVLHSAVRLRYIGQLQHTLTLQKFARELMMGWRGPVSHLRRRQQGQDEIKETYELVQRPISHVCDKLQPCWKDEEEME